ncbi:MAG: molybdopterin molybdotransferase MoeA [Candidatus Delongbacteria bacterium]|nr:molybdopterin molybdotransferase MoeA [Candidatus Delongbacteria bacterium]
MTVTENSPLHSVQHATQLIHSVRIPPETEWVPWTAAIGRVLAQPIRADRDFPPFDRVAMDGVALQHSRWVAGQRVFPVQGSQAAGQPRGTLASPEACLEVMTGAPLPRGCDCVIPVELLAREGGGVRLSEDAAPVPMRHVHLQASDRKQGDCLLNAGTRLRSPEIAVAVTVGLARIPVIQRPRITVLATGDELVPVENTPLPHQIRQSNGPALVAALQRAGHDVLPLCHVPDDAIALDLALERALGESRVVVLSGGVSMGRHDLVPEALARHGVRAVFHKVSQRPGKPLWFGRDESGHTVFALPGNPVSTAVCLHRYVLPWLEHCLTGIAPEPQRLRLAEDVSFQAPLSFFLPVKLDADSEGRALARPVPTAGSGDFARLCASDGFVELPRGPRLHPAGESVPWWPWI